ncbi:hypothetical protein [Maridesulfovibrio ferrireducens]|uniref:hypothetical protein n=1 Tax=Maridesulfovibrio ferrireducens TaxID=246191 RepID=UPI001A20BE71|nr:hypothetical protein [Maridesulfovibrio ferrireducens]MBI9110247.1 hypothetical protein [Maridesulfovibrio ferrireducens]
MNELKKTLSETLNRMEKEQSHRLDDQDQRIPKMEKALHGCRDLLSELERVGNVVQAMKKLMQRIKKKPLRQIGRGF